MVLTANGGRDERTTKMDDSNGDASVDKLTESEARKEALAEEAEDRLHNKGAHWRDWMYIGDEIAVGQAKAMRAANTNKPFGRAYTRAFGDWLKARPWAERIDTGTRANLLWIMDHRSQIDDWRDRLAQNERDKMNHPTTCKRRYEATHKIKDGDPNAKKRETAKEAYLRELAIKDAEIAKLKQQLRNGENGSLFDLRKSPLKTIGKIIGENMDLDRMKQLQKEIARQIADRKAKLTPAQAG